MHNHPDRLRLPAGVKHLKIELAGRQTTALVFVVDKVDDCKPGSRLHPQHAVSRGRVYTLLASMRADMHTYTCRRACAITCMLTFQ